MNSYAMQSPTKNINFANEGATTTTTPSTIAATTIARALPKPKRPLSAFNLFYRYKRQHIISKLAANAVGSVSKDTLRQLIEAPPGLEDCYKYTMVDASPEQVIQLRQQNIREELKDSMNARDAKARAHRKDKSMAGSLSFVELGKLMNKSWKESCDDVAKEVFNALAEVGRNKYRQQVKEYHDMNKLLGLGKVSKASKKKKKRKQDEEDETTKITKLSNQMDIATEKSNNNITNSSSSPPLQRDVSTDSSKLSDEDDNMVVASLLQLSNQRTATPPVKRRKTNGPIKKRVLNTVEKPNLLDLLSSNNSVEDRRSTVDLPRRSVMSMQQTMADLSIRPNQGGYTYPRPPTSFDTLPNESELISRVMDMERQLTRERNERVRSRMLVLQDQISRGLFDSAITEQTRGNVPVPPPNHTLPMGNNQESLLRSLVSASMARQSAQQEQEQRAMLLHKILSQRSQPPPCTAPLVHKDTVPRAA